MSNLSNAMLTRVILVVFLSPIVAIPNWAQHQTKYANYQKASSGDYSFEGIIISEDGREPKLGDEFWAASVSRNKSKRKLWEDKLPFEYVVKITNLKNSAEAVREIRLSNLPLAGNDEARRGPLWFVGYSRDTNIVSFLHYQGQNGKVGTSMYQLRYWSLNENKFLEESAEVDTFQEHGIDSVFPYVQPKAYLSPSGKYIAIVVWHEEFDEKQTLKNHIELFSLRGEKRSLEEVQTIDVVSRLKGRQAQIREVRWNADDQLECVFTQTTAGEPKRSNLNGSAKLVNPTNSDSSDSDVKSYARADLLFSK